MATSPGPVALVGSGEFLSYMEAVDSLLLEGRPKKVAVIPTAAALEGTERLSYWLDLAHRHYDELGVETVDVAVTDRHDADSPDMAALVRDVGLIYLSGGDPHHLASTLRSTLVWEAVLEQWNAGAALAGCSAGAMALTSGAPPGLRPASASGRSAHEGPQVDAPTSPAQDVGAGVANGLGVVETLAVIPHYDQMKRWMSEADEFWSTWKPAKARLIGIDEDTAIVSSAAGWEVHGRQGAWVLDTEPLRHFGPGEVLDVTES